MCESGPRVRLGELDSGARLGYIYRVVQKERMFFKYLYSITESLFLKKLLDSKNAMLNVPLLHGY
jgi:hypothetical protein